VLLRKVRLLIAMAGFAFGAFGFLGARISFSFSDIFFRLFLCVVDLEEVAGASSPLSKDWKECGSPEMVVVKWVTTEGDAMAGETRRGGLGVR